MKQKIFKKGMARRLLSVVLAVAMVVSLMPVHSIHVYAAEFDGHTCSDDSHSTHCKLVEMRDGNAVVQEYGLYAEANPFSYGRGQFAEGNFPTEVENGTEPGAVWWYKSEATGWRFNVCTTTVAHIHTDHYGVTTTNTANDTLTWYCGEDGCNSSATSDNPIKLTLSASSANYSSSAVEASYGEGEAAAWKTNVGTDAPIITYEAKTGSNLTDGKAVNVGSYTAKVSITVTPEGSDSVTYTATKDFEITKKTWTEKPKVIISDFKQGTYSDAGEGKITNDAGIKSGVSYFYNTTNSNEGGTPWSAAAVNALSENTSYYAYAVFSGENGNMDAITTDPVKFTVLHNHGLAYSIGEANTEIIAGCATAADNYQVKAKLIAENMEYSGNDAYNKYVVENKDNFENATGKTITTSFYDSNNQKLDAAPINAGSYKVEISIDDTNKISKEFTISKKKITAPKPGTVSYTYNGENQTYAFAEGGDSSYYTVEDNVQKNAGDHTVTVKLNDIANTEWASGSTDNQTYTFTISKKKITAPKAQDWRYVYNKKAQTLRLTNTNDIDYYNIEGDVQTNAGTHTVKAILKDKANTEWADNSSTNDRTLSFTIEKMKVPKPLGDPRTFVYTGEQQEFLVYSIIGSNAYNLMNSFYKLTSDSKSNFQTNIGSYNIKVEPMPNFEWEDGTTTPISYTYTIKKNQMSAGVYYLEDNATGDLLDGYVWGSYLQDDDNAANLKVSTHYTPYLYNAPENAMATFYVKDGNKTYRWKDLTYNDLNPGIYYVYAIVHCAGYEVYTTPQCPIKVYNPSCAVYVGKTYSQKSSWGAEFNPMNFPICVGTTYETKTKAKDYQLRTFATLGQAYQYMYNSLKGKADYSDIVYYSNNRQARVMKAEADSFAKKVGIKGVRYLASIDESIIPDDVAPIDDKGFSYAAGLVDVKTVKVDTEEDVAASIALMADYMDTKCTVTYLLNYWDGEPEAGEKYDYTSVHYKKEVKTLDIGANPTEYVPVREGFKFEGWYVAKDAGEDGSIELSPEGSEWTFEKDAIKWDSNTNRLCDDTTLIARWSTTQHDWKYVVDEKNPNVLKAVCTAEVHKNDFACNKGISLTINVSNAIYSGNAVKATYGESDVEAWKNAIGTDAPIITYEAKDGSALTDGKAVNVGQYTAKATVGDVTITKDFAITKDGWTTENDTDYWYENGEKQGVKLLEDGTPDPSYRGKEIYDPETDAWYWLENAENGKKAVNKDVYIDSLAGDWGDATNEAGESTGKWVRYDKDGKMVKGWDTNDNGKYYFDKVYGTMAKGYATIDGTEYYFNKITGVLEKTIGEVAELTGWKTVDGADYWYENGARKGVSANESFRGKEIYDPETDAWYWLDNNADGKKAVSKDVYQESLAGDWGESTNAAGEKIGKWVRYDENGHMVKGWNTTEAGTYYFDLIYGTMAKGTVVIDGKEYTFDKITGIMVE